MTAGRLAVSEILDDAAEVAMRVAAPWMGLLWLSALPLRFLQMHFAARVMELGGEAAQYGDYLGGLALAATAALVPSLWGRAVYVRAVGLGLRSERVPGSEALRLSTRGFAAYLYASLVIDVLFLALAPTLIAIPMLILFAGLAAAAHPQLERLGPIAPLREIARQLTEVRVLSALLFVFGVALVAAWVNLYFLFRLGLWLAGAVPGLDPTPWAAALGPSRSLVLVLLVGAVLAVEPFWLAALTVFVHKARSRETGEDLRLWFERLRTRDAA